MEDRPSFGSILACSGLTSMIGGGLTGLLTGIALVAILLDHRLLQYDLMQFGVLAFMSGMGAACGVFAWRSVLRAGHFGNMT